MTSYQLPLPSTRSTRTSPAGEHTTGGESRDAASDGAADALARGQYRTFDDLLAAWFTDLGGPYAQVQGENGYRGRDRHTERWVWCRTYMDFDLIQAYLLEIDEPGPPIRLYGRSHRSRVADQVALIWDAGELHVTWREQPFQRWPGGPDSFAIAADGWTWFSRHIHAWFRDRHRDPHQVPD